MFCILPIDIILLAPGERAVIVVSAQGRVGAGSSDGR
jgi:hypothetical protein